MDKKNRPDYILLGVVGILLVLGILVLANVSAVFSQDKFDKPTYYLFHQILFGILPGIIAAFILYKISLAFIKKWSWLFVSVNLALMVLVFIPFIGIVSGGAPRWINLWFFTFQPSEALKLSFLIYLSVWLTTRKTNKDWKFTFFPFLVILGVVAFLLYLQSDLSTLIVIISVAGIVYFLSETPIWQMFTLIGLGTAFVWFLIKFVPYRMNRILVFLDPRKDPMGIGYQIKQALIAVGSGGITGVGLGMSVQKYGRLPQTMSDSIFAIFAEETGFIGSAILIILYLLLLWRGFKIAKESKDKFFSLFAAGISGWICIQAFINVGAMIGVLPLTGIPLPFIGYGGSHIITELAAVGLLLNISKR